MNIEYTHVPCRTFSLWLPNGGRRIVNQIQTEEWPDLAAPEGPRWHILKLSSNLKNQGFLSTSSTGLRTFRQWPMLRLKVLRSVMGLKALDFNQFFYKGLWQGRREARAHACALQCRYIKILLQRYWHLATTESRWQQDLVNHDQASRL